jgi:SAM-dependent methyltransferase
MFARAEAYESFMGRWSRRLAPGLLRFSGVQENDAVLDVGCGTGSFSFTVLDAIKSVRVTGIDPSEGYLSHAARSRVDPRVSFQIGDARSLPFADASFDRVVSMLVLNFVPEPEQAVREWARVTKSGGTVIAAVWDYADGMEMLRVFWDQAKALDPASEPRDEAHMRLCKTGELEALWQRAGLVDVVGQPLVVPLEFSSFDDYWQPFLLGQGPAGAYVVGLADDARERLKERIRERVLGTDADRPSRCMGARGQFEAPCQRRSWRTLIPWTGRNNGRLRASHAVRNCHPNKGGAHDDHSHPARPLHRCSRALRLLLLVR